MILLITSFLAGVLSVLAPCIVAFIPVILARSVGSQRRPWVVIASLAVSILLFSILLKSSTLLIDVPSSVWSMISGLIVLVFGLLLVFPHAWDWISLRSGLATRSQQQFAGVSGRQGIVGDMLVGASLGPVFSACSPTYALIVATILPAEPLIGLGYLLAYVAGLTLILALIAIFGRQLLTRMKWGINPEGSFRKILGIVLIVIGASIVLGLDKLFLSFLIENGLFDWQINLESGLME